MADFKTDQHELEKKIIHAVFGDIKVPVTSFRNKYLSDIILPKKVSSFLTGKDTWTSTPSADVFVSQDEAIKQSAAHDWMYPKEDITSLDQLIGLVKRSDFMQAGRAFDAEEVYESDDVGKSHHVYRSQNVINSSHISSCNWIWDAEYLFGCMRSGASTFCIGMIEGVNCSNSYRILGSHNIVSSYMIKNSYDLQDCLLCSHIQHKQYCIANMQYSKEEYFELKEKILGWMFNG